MKKFFKDFNFNERTDKGVPIYKPTDIRGDVRVWLKKDERKDGLIA